MDSAETVQPAYEMEDIVALTPQALPALSVTNNLQPQLEQEQQGQREPDQNKPDQKQLDQKKRDQGQPDLQEPTLQELEAKLQLEGNQLFHERLQQTNFVQVQELQEKFRVLNLIELHAEIEELQKQPPQVDKEECAELLKKPTKQLECLEKKLKSIQKLHTTMIPIQYKLEQENAALTVPPAFPLYNDMPMIQQMIQAHGNQLQDTQDGMKLLQGLTKEEIQNNRQLSQINIDLSQLQFKELYHRQRAQYIAQQAWQLDVDRRKKRTDRNYTDIFALTQGVAKHLERREAYEKKIMLVNSQLRVFRKTLAEHLRTNEEPGMERIKQLLQTIHQEVEHK